MKKLFRILLTLSVIITLLIPSTIAKASTTISYSALNDGSPTIMVTNAKEGELIYDLGTVKIDSFSFYLRGRNSPTGNITFTIRDGTPNVHTVLWSQVYGDASSFAQYPAAHQWYTVYPNYTVSGNFSIMFESGSDFAMGSSQQFGTYSKSANPSSYGKRLTSNNTTWGEAETADDWFSLTYSDVTINTPTLGATTAVLDYATGNLTLTGNIDNIGTSNVTTVGFKVAPLADAYTTNYSESVNYGSNNTAFTRSLSPTDLGLVVGDNYKVISFATNSYGTSYGSEFPFTWVGYLNVTTFNGVSYRVDNGVTSYIFLGNLEGNNSSAFRGIQIRPTGSSTWPIKLEEIAYGGNATGLWHGTSGWFAEATTLLTANTTYDYRAYGVLYDPVTSSQYYVYGDTYSFLTNTSGYSSSAPVVTTNTVVYLNGVLSVSGTVVTSAYPITERGIKFGLTSSLGSSSSDLGSFPTGIFTKSTTFVQAGGIAYTAGTSLFVQAYATNSIGLTSTANVIEYVIPNYNVGVGGMTIVNTGADVTNNTAKLNATITNPSEVTITRVGWAWGLTASANDESYNTPVTSNPTAISHYIYNLDDTAVYWYKAGVLTNQSPDWLWSEATSFTTGASLPVMGDIPSVLTKSATTIGKNFFTANGELISVGSLVGSEVSQLGFAISYTPESSTNPVESWEQRLTAGNFTPANFNKVIGLDRSSVIVYYSAVAVNQYGTAFGKPFYVNLSGSASENTTQEQITPPEVKVSNWLERWGMNNSTGKWLFVIFLMVVLFLLFHESKFLRVLMPTLAFGWGMVSNFVDLWVTVLLAVIIGLVVVYILKKGMD